MLGKQTFHQLNRQTRKSVRSLQRQFDQLAIEPIFPAAPNESINLIVDATFFSRSDGILVFRAYGKNLYWHFIKSETIKEVANGLDELEKVGYRFKSVTLDGRKGMIKLFRARYPDIPIQLCQFHQAQIIRRYLTLNPKTDCGKHLKLIMRGLTNTRPNIFQSLVETWAEICQEFLDERNEKGAFKHRKLRSASRSLKTNMPYLFTYKKHPELNIPNTTNSCDGSFAHWKQKIKIHRGLKKHRRNKMINFLLSQS